MSTDASKTNNRIIIPKAHLGLQSSHDIQSLGLEFFTRHQISFFDFARVYQSGEMRILGSNSQVIQGYYANGFSTSPAELIALPHKKSIYMLDERGNGKILNFLKYFQLDNPFCIIHRYLNYFDVFSICIDAPLTQAVNFMLNGQDIIDNFLDYFLENTQPLLQQQDTVHLPQYIRQNVASVFLPEVHKRKAINLPGTSYTLTAREVLTMKYLLRGRSAKQIARLLNISPRTVEDHIYRVRNKLNCNNRTELISMLEQYPIDWNNIYL